MWWLWPQENVEPPSPQQLYAQYAEAAPSQTLPTLNQQLLSAPNDPELLRAYGIALMENGRYEEAALSFDQLSAFPPFADEALWHHALLYLKQNQIAESISVLEQFPAKARRSQQAQELLQQLKSL